MGWAAQRNGWQASRYRRRNGGIGAQRQDQCQRAGPECGRELLGPLVERGQGARGRHGWNVNDQRIEVRPALGTIDRRDGFGLIGPRGQPIDCLGRQCDNPAITQ